MANRLIINGKNTLERLQEEFQRLLDSHEHISVTEFASRVGISYHTLTHRHKNWAEKVRKLRDEGRAKPRKRSPATQSQDDITSLEEAEEVIEKLRKRIIALEGKLSVFTEEEDSRQKRLVLNKQLKEKNEQNERLRGVVISLQQEIVRYTSPELSRRLMDMIEKHAASLIEDGT
jgi:glutamate mutase epsilon subunit